VAHVLADAAIVEIEIRRLSAQVAAAERRKDADAVARYLAADYVGIDPSGKLIDRTELIERYRRSDFHLDTLWLTDISVSAGEDSAWEVGLMQLAGTLGERQFSGRYRYSHFWVRSGQHWLIGGSQMTPMTA
jgi:ketosteroid isomerase-like protein